MAKTVEHSIIKYYAVLTKDKKQIVVDSRRIDKFKISCNPIYQLYDIDYILGSLNGRHWGTYQDMYLAKEVYSAYKEVDPTADINVYEIFISTKVDYDIG